jgi:hypothetical protein
MKINIKGYITHKISEQYADCADRYSVNSETNRFAIADGVSRSFFPAIWAELLVNKYVSLKECETFEITDCQKDWEQQVGKIVSETKKFYIFNAWNEKKPGLATLVGLRFDSENKKCFASALGDSFLFFIPRGSENDFEKWTKLSSKPEPVIFDSYPDYYLSRPDLKGNIQGTIKDIEFDLQEGTFYLMTDALSEWVYNQKKEKSFDYIKENWTCQADFERSIAELRKHEMGNDDSAVLIIDLQDDGISEFTYESVDVQYIKPLVDNEKEEFKRIEKEEADKAEQQKKGQKEKENTTQVEKQDETRIEKKNEIQEINSDNIQKNTYKSISNILDNAIGQIKYIFKNGVKSKKKRKPISNEELENIKKKIKEEYGISFED